MIRGFFCTLLFCVLWGGLSLTAAAPDAAASPDAGQALLRAGRIDEAIASLEATVAATPGQPAVPYLLNRAYRLARRNDRAATLAADLLRGHPDSPYTHKLLGESLDAAFRDADAEREFRRALTLAPEMPELHFALGLICFRRGQDPCAESEF